MSAPGTPNGAPAQSGVLASPAAARSDLRWIAGSVVAILLLVGYGLIATLKEDARCERAGGVPYRSLCIDKSSVVEP